MTEPQRDDAHSPKSESPPPGRDAGAALPASWEGRGRRLAGFRLVRELGRGGMGIVYEALDESKRRRVALKVLHPGLLENERAVARFRREAQALSRLDHPAICPVYEAGFEGGLAFLAMKYLEGQTLARRCLLSEYRMRDLDDSEDERLEEFARPAAEATDASTRDLRRSSPAEIARGVELIEKVARALHVAHEAGIIHRDIKPGNIMVASEGEPVLLDFGLARDMEDEDSDLTRSGDLLGTPAYTSPEQIRGEVRQIDRRSDVYSLGATLYEVLTHHPPFEAPTRHALYQEILNSPPPDCRQLDRAIANDLKVVVETALEKEPARRYQTALELAEDLRRFRQGERIRARPPGPVIRVRRWAKRHPVLGTAILAAFILLSAALAASLHLLERGRQELIREQGFRLAAQSTSLLSTDPGLALLVAIEGARRRPGLIASNALLAALQAQVEERTLVGHTGAVHCAFFSPDGQMVVTASRDNTACVWRSDTGILLRRIDVHSKTVGHAGFSPDGRRIVTASNDQNSAIVTIEDGKTLLLEGHEGAVEHATFDPRGALVATASRDAGVRIWDAETGELLHVLSGHQAPVAFVAFSPDGTVIASAGEDGEARVWEMSSLKSRWIVRHDAEVRHLSFSRDGRRLATASGDHTARILDLETGAALVLSGHTDTVRTAFFDAEGRRVLTASGDNTARIWDAETGLPIAVLPPEEAERAVGHYDAVRYAAWSPDGSRVVTASKDKTVRVWESATGIEEVRLLGHRSEVRTVEFHPGGTRIVSASYDGTARIWNPWTPRIPALEGHLDMVRMATFSPDGALVLTASKDQTARIWRVATRDPATIYRGHSATVWGARFSPDGELVVSISKDGEGHVWSAATGEEIFRLRGLDGDYESAVFSPDSRRLASVEERKLRVRDALGGGVLLEPDLGEIALDFPLFSPDGAVLLAVSSAERIACALDSRSGDPIAVLEGHAGEILCASFDPSGERVVTGDDAESPTALVWEVCTGRQMLLLAGHEDAVKIALFSPRGHRILTAGDDDTAILWDAATGRRLLSLRHTAAIEAAAFAPSGRILVTACRDATARLWDAERGKEILTLLHDGVVYHAAFRPDGRSIVTASGDKTVRIWPVDPVRLAEACRPRELLPGEW